MAHPASTLLTAMKQTTSHFIAGFHTWTAAALLAPRSADCIQEIRPKSLATAPMTNEQFREFFEGRLRGGIWDVKITVLSELHDPVQRSSAVHVLNNASSVIGPYENEYVFLLYFDERGETIVRIVEMVDSKYASEFLGSAEAWMAEQGEGAKAASGGLAEGD